MEPIDQNNSDDFLNNQEMNEDINDIGLPKSSLHNFVKEILAKNKVRGDKNIIPMLDKISRQYVTYISSYGAKICTECGKKTLNLEHILEALKKMKFQKHIEKLVEHLKKNGEIDTSKYDQLEDEKKNENKNLKQLINKKKKRGGRKAKCFEDEKERDEMKRAQAKMFEEARNDMNRQQEQNQMENFGYALNDGENEENENYDEGNENKGIDLNEQKGKEHNIDNDKNKEKDKYDEIDKKLLINNGGDEDINFD
jgi:histone H3/H4